MTAGLESFGRVFPPAADTIGAEEAVRRLKAGTARPDSLLAYGNGRSYGDSCLNPAGTLIDMRSMNRIIAFDPLSGVIEAEAGALLCDIIAYVAPHGFFPQVVPGTQFVTLGGAIANDVHGKNHHRRGTFGCHVEGFTLLRSDGKTYRCSPDFNPHLYSATIGGLGLTGLILTATIRLMHVPSLDVVERVVPFRDLCEFFDLVEEADFANEYAVAWIDQLARVRSAGRGLLMTGNHAEHGSVSATHPRQSISVAFQPPINLLNRPVLKVFNRAYRVLRGFSQQPHSAPYQRFFFQLDGVGRWNRLYGPNGLYQHQSVLPEETAREAIPELLAMAKKAGQGSFLTVLKRFGSVRSPGLISFPKPGYTLTLDFPNRGAKTLALLKELDALTIEAGGAVNPYKDARMDAETFAASFPNWRDLEALRDPAFISRFWQRTADRISERPIHGMEMRAAE
jgi:FAD/FMN-containing dehydrogenase